MKTVTSAGVFFLFASFGGAADTVPQEIPKTLQRSSTEVQTRKQPSVAPLKSGAVSTHVPFGTGECSLCHVVKKDGKGGGPLLRPGNQTCYFCHEDVKKVMESGRFQHKTAQARTNCHSPHNSVNPKLLLAKLPTLCLDCHVGIRKRMSSEVKHAALTSALSCTGCHSPHASNVEKILLRLPYEQCVGCHSADDMTDA